jgi:hypothetical protein
MGVKVELSGGLGIGNRGLFVQQQDQTRSLAPVRGLRACWHESSGLGEELLREGEAIVRQRSGDGTAPGVSGHSTRPVLFGTPTRI